MEEIRNNNNTTKNKSVAVMDILLQLFEYKSFISSFSPNLSKTESLANFIQECGIPKYLKQKKINQLQECQDLRFQSSILNEGRGGRRYLPSVFTEQRIAMLYAVLHTETTERNYIQGIKKRK